MDIRNVTFRRRIKNLGRTAALLMGMWLSLLFLPYLAAQDMNNSEDNIEKEMEVATFGAGCFWCVEAIFERVRGVAEVKSGYSGGHVKNPSYKEVCSGSTGHAEVCQISYNPKLITYSELLEVFWKTHNPTTLNRQGNDIGTQYRSAVFYHTEEQKRIAEEMKSRLNLEKIWEDPIITEIVAFEEFYPAEDFHEDYYARNPNQGYCNFIITPKINKFEKIFKDYLKEEK